MLLPAPLLQILHTLESVNVRMKRYAPVFPGSDHAVQRAKQKA